jgi:hypothetical protein
MKTVLKLTWGQLLEGLALTGSVALHYIGVYIWHPAESYLVILGLVGADFLAGAGHAYRCGRFETRKALRGLYKLAGYSLLLAAAHNLGKYESWLAWLPQAVFVPLALLLLLSFIKNLSLLGWIPEPLAHWLEQRIDAYKNDPKP